MDYTQMHTQAQELLLRLRRRQLYVFCDECNVPPAQQAQGFRKPTAADIVSHHTSDGLVSSAIQISALALVLFDVCKSRHAADQPPHFGRPRECCDLHNLPCRW